MAEPILITHNWSLRNQLRGPYQHFYRRTHPLFRLKTTDFRLAKHGNTPRNTYASMLPEVDVTAADTTRTDVQQNLSFARFRNRLFDQMQCMFRVCEARDVLRLVARFLPRG